MIIIRMQLNKLLAIILFLIFSCKGDAQKNNAIQQKSKHQSIQSTNFFDKKYASDYTLIVDESTLADHPIQTFLDCKDSYFTIHYIPKNKELKDFWTQEYFQNRNMDNIDFEKESKEIEAKIKANISGYAVFCYYIPAKYIESNNGCTIESAYMNEKTVANIYYYNFQNKNWQLIKNEKSQYLPRIIEAKYFSNNFPNYFNPLISANIKNETKANTATENKSILVWNGKYEGTFLRLKEESADPRAWGKISLEIKDKNANFNLDTYNEIAEKKLLVLDISANELKLEDKATNKFLKLKKEAGKIFMQGNLMESIVGENEIYEIKKNIE